MVRMLLAATAAIALAPAAIAQDAGAAPAEAPAATAPGATAYTDDQVMKFAEATVEVNKIQGDATIADDQKQPKMAEALQQKGIDPQTYNEIAVASNSDEALRNRIIAAATALQSAPAQTPSASADDAVPAAEEQAAAEQATQGALSQ